MPAALGRKLGSVQTSLREIDASRLARALPVVIASWLLEACVLYGTANVLGTHVSITTAIGATAFTILFQVIHLTPGGIGVCDEHDFCAHARRPRRGRGAHAGDDVTHGFKFAYSFTVAVPFAVSEAVSSCVARATTEGASGLEIVVARTWNVFNEGKPFTPVFSLIVLGLLALPHATDLAYWPRFRSRPPFVLGFAGGRQRRVALTLGGRLAQLRAQLVDLGSESAAVRPPKLSPYS